MRHFAGPSATDFSRGLVIRGVMARNRKRPSPSPLPDLPLTVDEAAQLARVERRTVHRWIAHGFFAAIRPIASGSSRRLIDRTSFLKFLGFDASEAA